MLADIRYLCGVRFLFLLCNHAATYYPGTRDQPRICDEPATAGKGFLIDNLVVATY